MRIGSVAYADEQIAKQAERAANKTSGASKQPLILYFYDGLQVHFRPLYDLNGCIVAMKHAKWTGDVSTKIDAICAKEIDQPCELCERAKTDRDLLPKESWFLPVYVHQVVRTKDAKTGKSLDAPEVVTYEDNGETKPVRGIRLIEFQLFGAIYDSYKYFRDFMRYPDENGKMTDRDFKITQDGKGKGQKSFLTDKKDPKSRPDIAKITPTLERVFERLIEARPPVTTAESIAEQHWNETGQNMVIPMNAQESVDDIPEF
jgi:hypothetical protein